MFVGQTSAGKSSSINTIYSALFGGESVVKIAPSGTDESSVTKTVC